MSFLEHPIDTDTRQFSPVARRRRQAIAVRSVSSVWLGPDFRGTYLKSAFPSGGLVLLLIALSRDRPGPLA